ncbi:MAG: DUF3530 family protein [Casimicrobiaceae bacterium]
MVAATKVARHGSARAPGMLAVLALALACAQCALAQAPDYARESRWAAEVAPSVMVGDVVWLKTPDRERVLALFTPARSTTLGGVVIVHGLGVQPDFGVVGELRGALAARGYATLSVQMPVLDVDALPAEYEALFPIAGDRIEAALRWLAAKQIAPTAVVAHSMGAAMSNAWLARASHADIRAWVVLGMGVPFAAHALPPVLDITAEHDLPAVLANAPLRALSLPKRSCSAAVRIAGADHFLAGRADELADVIAPFLARAFAAGCNR